jgi:large conductance mechanosensitive channel
MRAFLNEFKKFIIRGNVLDLAVAVVIGVAFTAVVQSFANDVLMQLIAAVFGKPSFNNLTITLHDAVIRYGAFLTAVVNFVIVAFGVFLAIKAFERLQNLRQRGEVEEIEPLTREGELLQEIRDLLRAQAGN